MDRSRFEVAGPLAPHVAGFASELERLGYTASPVKKHCYLVARLSGWLDELGLDVDVVATPLVEPFFVARRAAGVANLRTRASLKPLIGHLEAIGMLRVPGPPAPTSDAERLLAAFGTYLSDERGLVAGTVRFYAYVAGLLVEERTMAGGLPMSGLTVGDVTGFTARVCEGRGLSSCRQVV